MEVDLQPATESRHSSPFARMHSPVSVTASASASTSVSPAPSAGQRSEQKKRRRGGYAVTSGDSTNKRTGSSYYEEGEDETAGFDDEERSQAAVPSSKRRNILIKRFSDDSSHHHYRSLGVATGLNGVWLSDSEYGVDSPMHSLSLASPSPPLTPVVATDTDDRRGGGGGGGDIGGTNNNDDDIDMGSNETDPPSASPTLPLIPRQVTMHRSHSTPFRPSPLIQAQAFTSSSQSSNISRKNEATHALSPIHVPENTDLERIKRDDTIADSSASCSSKASSPRQQPRRLDARAATPTLLEEEGNRTPSPGPASFASPTDSTPSKGSRRLHHSPGLTQTSFPGGKHMLRYTMGYREDCDACKSKTPGHYGHVMHR